ncbi:TetR/AcrR family transcriptional regulator [Actinomadura opuntiae]|uniref:TetR/AcrR family transcriptional regulator n=1 Tax=Actinomadura sp. OS1-43 TaxID=604315 RepID=UPI00255B1096|nr:TetR/AcrR family transcriptional regulator [Actinomadura sp. OS1-43]MDL4819331.1 TetR/AcrR family transcriptional regulator [Actinomadura sp. OS1-43]
MRSTPEQRRAARHRSPAGQDPAARTAPRARRKQPITVDLIVDTALEIVAAEGYEALTMRRVATALKTGPASLYFHVVNKTDLDDLLIGRLSAELAIPEPDPAAWREQIIDVCAQMRDQYLRYPGISRAALAVMPTNLETLRVSEGMLSILLAGGVPPQTAAWTCDALTLYVNAYSLETSLRMAQPGDTERAEGDDAWVLPRGELLSRFAALPDDQFPNTRRHAAELTAGTGHERFDFTLNLMLDGLTGR